MLLLLLLTQATPQAPPRDPKPRPSVRMATVAGRVVDAETNTPIAHALVQVWPARPSGPPRGVETGPQGDFRVDDLGPGAYRIVASPPDFRATHVPQELNLDRARDDLRIALPRGLALDGQVVDERGEPMPGVTVSAGGMQGMPPSLRGRETDDRGLFRVFGLRPDTYRVCAAPSRTARPAGAGRSRGAPYLTTCYPSAPAGGGERIAVDGTPRAPLTIVMQRLPGFAISGRVKSESSNQQVQVTILRLGQPASGVIPVTLQSGGVFRAGGLPPGRYLVHANAGAAPIPPLAPAAVERAYRIVELTTGNVAGLELVMTRDAAATIAQDLALLPPETPPAPVHSNDDPASSGEMPSKARRFAISGRVADGDGNPLSGVRVAVASRAGGAGAMQQFSATDDRGSFRIFDLPPGRHAVCASPGGPLPFATEAPRRSLYVSTCSPFVSREADATQVTLTDHDVEGLEIRLQRRPVYAINGQILSADGDIAPAAQINVLRTDVGFPVSSGGSIQPTGSFRLSNLFPGSYLVSARNSMTWSGPHDPQWGAVRVEVTSDDVEGVVLQLKRGVRAKGLVTFDDQPPASFPLWIQARWADAGSRPGSPPVALVADDGTFELAGLFGPVVVTARPDLPTGFTVGTVVTVRSDSPVGYVVAALRYRGKDVTDMPIEFEGGPGDGLEVVLTNRTATLAGVVRDSSGNAPASAVVICFPVDPQRWAHFESRRAETSADGSWSLPSLPAGEYHVAALPAEEAKSLVFPADYTRLADVAPRVKVQPREVRTLDLRVVTLGR